MIIVLIREKLNRVDFNKKVPDCRLGKLYINGVEVCDTLENPFKLIPAGCYCWSVSLSPKFKRDLPLVFNKDDVQADRGIRVHAGNTAKDSEGCILVGHHKAGDDRLTSSLETEHVLTRMTKRGLHRLVIVEDWCL